MYDVLEKVFTRKELEEFLMKDFSDDEIEYIREYIVEYYECAGFDNVRETYKFDFMSNEEILEWFGRLKVEEIDFVEENRK